MLHLKTATNHTCTCSAILTRALDTTPRCNNNTAEVILKSDGSTDAGEGGCAYLYSAANVTIYGSEVVSNSGDTGGAIYAVGGFNSFTVDGGSNISNNSGLRYGGAICVLQPSKDGVLEFRGGSMIAGNTAGGTSVGGVLFVNQDVDRVTVRGANIVNNTGYEGGAFALNDLNTLEVVGNSTVYGNQATGGSGGFAKISDVYGTLRIGDGSTLAGNFASKSGGCVSAMTLANLEVTGGSVLANNAAGSGGMLSVEWVGSITIAGGSAVRSNVARGDGGGAVAIREVSEDTQRLAWFMCILTALPMPNCMFLALLARNAVGWQRNHSWFPLDATPTSRVLRFRSVLCHVAHRYAH